MSQLVETTGLRVWTNLHERAQQPQSLAYGAVVRQAGGGGVVGLAETSQDGVTQVAHLAAQIAASPLHKHLDQCLHSYDGVHMTRSQSGMHLTCDGST